MSKFINLNDWVEEKLYPNLFQRIPEAFPEMEFVWDRNKWRSKFHTSGIKDSKSSFTTYIYENKPQVAKDYGGNGNKELIEMYRNFKGCSREDAICELAELCGLAVPEIHRERYEHKRSRRILFEEANNAFVSALWGDSTEALQVREYLHSRGWSDEVIKASGVGMITKELRSYLHLPEDAINQGNSVGQEHNLTIPFKQYNNIEYFIVKRTDGGGISKILKPTGISNTSFFGITRGCDRVVIVEGDMDALHAQALGAKNVVATLGAGSVTDKVEDAIKKGVKKFILLFDNDPTGFGYIPKAIEVLEKYDVSVYVSSLPHKYKDTDEYLKEHSIDEWETEVKKNTKSASVWKYSQIEAKWKNKDISQDERDDLFAEVETLVNNEHTKPQDRQLIMSLFKSFAVNLEGYDTWETWTNQNQQRIQRLQQAEDTNKAVNRIKELMEENRVEEALKLMEETSSRQKSKANASKFASVFAPLGIDGYTQLLSQINEGIPTGIVFKQNNIEEELTLNTGITFVCANRGHGKTSFLNNIVLNEAERNKRLGNDKKVLYFSYEIAKRHLILDLLNTFVHNPRYNNTKVSDNPQRSIRDYFIKGSDFITGEMQPYFEEKKNELFGDLDEHLRLIDIPFKVGELLESIKYYTSTNSVSLICIDYAQLIYSEEYSRQRTEEIKRIVADIKDFANKTGIPFLIACQFNREVLSPASVDTRNIGEGGDFERVADTCIGLFNLKELKPTQKEDKEALDILKKVGLPMDELVSTPDKLFVRLLKRRNGYFPLDTILRWNGQTKTIEVNAPQRLFENQ